LFVFQVGIPELFLEPRLFGVRGEEIEGDPESADDPGQPGIGQEHPADDVGHIAQVLGIAGESIGAGGNELIAEPDGGGQPKRGEGPRADHGANEMEEEAGREAEPGMEDRAIEIEQPDEKEGNEDQAGEEPGGEELPGAGRGRRPKAKAGAADGKDKKEAIDRLDGD
jgi:hypothetical protein